MIRGRRLHDFSEMTEYASVWCPNETTLIHMQIMAMLNFQYVGKLYIQAKLQASLFRLSSCCRQVCVLGLQ